MSISRIFCFFSVIFNSVKERYSEFLKINKEDVYGKSVVR